MMCRGAALGRLAAFSYKARPRRAPSPVGILPPPLPFSPVPAALEDLRQGKMIVVVDDEDRENEGDLVIAAEHMTTEKMAFFIRHTGGVVCLALTHAIADQLDLPPMVMKN